MSISHWEQIGDEGDCWHRTLMLLHCMPEGWKIGKEALPAQIVDL